MPGGSGRELAFEFLASRPQTRVLYISGYSDQRSPTAPDSTLSFLGKPFSAKELTQKVGEILGND
jgi:DNA-binding NtrC family response regulator